jgi:hypothetical protein
VNQVTFGSGANTGFDPTLLNAETVSINTNYVRDHIDVLNSANWINAASYGASLNNANLSEQDSGPGSTVPDDDAWNYR